MKVPHTCPRLDHHLVLHCSDLCAEERAWINAGAAPFDANGVRNACLLLLCNCGPQNGSVLFLWALLCLSALSCCVDINVFPSLPSFVVSWKVLPGILKKHCCILPDRNTGKGRTDVPSPLNTPVTHTHSAAPGSGNNQWVVMLGNGCSVGGSHLSLYLFFCMLRTSVRSDLVCWLYALFLTNEFHIVLLYSDLPCSYYLARNWSLF